MTFQIQKFWKQIRIGDIRASSLAFINGVEHPSMEILYYSLTTSLWFFMLIAIKNETAASPNNLIASSQLVKY